MHQNRFAAGLPRPPGWGVRPQRKEKKGKESNGGREERGDRGREGKRERDRWRGKKKGRQGRMDASKF